MTSADFSRPESHDPRRLWAAVELGKLGYSVFPCWPRTKEPLTTHGFKDGTSDIAHIDAWWAEHPDANIAIATRGLVVIDVDSPDSAWFSENHDRLFESAGAITRTPRGGLHFYYRAPEEFPVRCSVGTIAPGVDVRADGGYAMVPCSEFVGVEYVCEDGRSLSCGPDDLPVLPDWLVQEIERAKKTSRSKKPKGARDGPIPEGERNDTLMRRAGAMRRVGLSEADIEAALQSINTSQCVPPLEADEVRKIAASAARYEPAKSATATDIVLGADEHRCVDDAIKAMMSDPDIFCRGTVLVRVVPNNRNAGRSGGVSIRQLVSATLRERLTLYGNILGYAKSGELEPAHPPTWLVSALEARAHWPGIRPLEAVNDGPLLREDGSVCCTDGYDPASQVLVHGTDKFPLMPEHPTLEDAKQAIQSLREVVCDYTFEAPEHRSGFLAAVLTMVGRRAFTGPSPLFMMDANVRGAGKGLLAQTAIVIGSGEEGFLSGVPADNEEMRKQITAAAVAGAQVIFFDNVTGEFGNASLDRALTTVRWRDRVLGKTEQVDLPLTPCWIATGNNIIVGADTTRRIVHVRLDVLSERPEERSGFKHPNLLAWVKQERSRLYVAALTILAAYIRAGRPAQNLTAYGSFDGWSDLIRSALVWCGEADPCLGNKRLAESVDSSRETLVTLVTTWAAFDPQNTGLVMADVVAGFFPPDRSPILVTEHAAEFRSALEALPGASIGQKPPTARSLGNALRSYRRRVVNELFIDTDPEKEKAAGKVWRIMDAKTKRPRAGISP